MGDGEGEKGEDFEMEREKFLSRVRERQSMDPFGMMIKTGFLLIFYVAPNFDKIVFSQISSKIKRREFSIFIIFSDAYTCTYVV